MILVDCSEGRAVEKENCLNALPLPEKKRPLPLRMTLQIATDFNLSQAQLAGEAAWRTDKYWPKQKHDLLRECVFFSLFAYPKRLGPGAATGGSGAAKSNYYEIPSRKWRKHVYRKLCVVAEKFHIIMFIKLLRALLGSHVHLLFARFLRRLIVMTNDFAASIDRRWNSPRSESWFGGRTPWGCIFWILTGTCSW